MFKILIPAGFIFIVITTFLYLKGTDGSHSTTLAKEVTYSTSDDVEIVADWYERPEPQAPVAILLHMLGSDRSSWSGLAAKLNEAGFSVLAPDWRGHGRSTERGSEILNYRQFKTEDFLAMDLDVHGAFAFLDKKDINRENIHVIGASIGANSALIIGAEIEIIRSVVLLSPAEDYRDIKTIPAAEVYKGRPALVITSSEDEPSYGGSKILAQIIGGSAKLLGQRGAGHGTEMLLRKPELMDEIVSFIKLN